MRDLKSDTFNDAVETIFAFLLERGFSIPSDGRTDTALTAGVQFVGKNAAVALGLDRRDQCIDCYVGAVKDGKAHPWDQAQGYWGHFHGFLVKHRGYRGSFREFTTEDQIEPEHIRTLKMYASALKTLGKDIVEDRPDIFVREKK